MKSSLGSNESDADDPGPSGGGTENAEHSPNRVVEPKEAERPLAERIMGQPDYADILSRSLDMLDRKYDFTPEGRSEAQKLALELELMKPAPAKPAKDFFGQTVDLVRRFRDAEQRASDGASIPPALDHYGHPNQHARRSPSVGGSATRTSRPPVAQPLLAVRIQTRPPRAPNRRPYLIRKLAAQGPAIL